jgi:hypothetical protein
MVTDIVSDKNPLYPGTKNDLVTIYTGIPPLDRQLAVLVAFFAPAVAGTNTALSLFLFFGFGQFGAFWALMVMESLRKGNQGKIVSL